MLRCAELAYSTVLFYSSLLHVDPSYRINIDDLIEFPWLEEAPDNRLHSPAVISDKVGHSLLLFMVDFYESPCLFQYQCFLMEK